MLWVENTVKSPASTLKKKMADTFLSYQLGVCGSKSTWKSVQFFIFLEISMFYVNMSFFLAGKVKNGPTLDPGSSFIKQRFGKKKKVCSIFLCVHMVSTALMFYLKHAILVMKNISKL
jgi:hypothetical protein